MLHATKGANLRAIDDNIVFTVKQGVGQMYRRNFNKKKFLFV